MIFSGVFSNSYMYYVYSWCYAHSNLLLVVVKSSGNVVIFVQMKDAVTISTIHISATIGRKIAVQSLLQSKGSTDLPTSWVK